MLFGILEVSINFSGVLMGLLGWHSPLGGTCTCLEHFPKWTCVVMDPCSSLVTWSLSPVSDEETAYHRSVHSHSLSSSTLLAVGGRGPSHTRVTGSPARGLPVGRLTGAGAGNLPAHAWREVWNRHRTGWAWGPCTSRGTGASTAIQVGSRRQAAVSAAK